MAEGAVVGGKKYSDEEVAKALRAMERTKEQSKKWREKAKTPENKAKALAAANRRRITQQLLIAKAKAKGITVSEEEVTRAIAASKKK